MTTRQRLNFSMRRGVIVCEMQLRGQAHTSGMVIDLGQRASLMMEPVMSAYGEGGVLDSMRPVFRGLDLASHTGSDATWRYVENFDDLFERVRDDARYVVTRELDPGRLQLPNGG